MAQRVSSCRLESCSLRSTADTWVSTVFTEMNSCLADLLVGVAAGDQPQHLALALGEPVQVLVDRRRVGGRGEGVEHEAGQPRREDGVAVGHPADRGGQLGAGDRLGDVAAGAAADHADDVLGGVGHRQREEPHVRQLGDAGSCSTAGPPPPGRCTSSSTTSGRVAVITATACSTSSASPTTSTGVAELGPHAGAEHPVVVDEHDAHPGLAARAAVTVALLVARRGISSWTSVPSPGELRTSAVPPLRSIRPTIDCRTPSRSAGTASRSKPGPRSRTKTVDLLGLDLGVDRTGGAARVLRGVDHRLARGLQQRGEPARRAGSRRRRRPRSGRRARPRPRRRRRSSAAARVPASGSVAGR